MPCFRKKGGGYMIIYEGIGCRGGPDHATDLCL